MYELYDVYAFMIHTIHISVLYDLWACLIHIYDTVIYYQLKTK